MSKVAVVYWSGTGNTESMANSVVAGAKGAGADVELFEVDSFAADKVADYDAVAFGCPAMGDEVLEEGSFEPMFADAESKLSGKPVALFGSYGWGGGAWMEDWKSRTEGAGAKVVGALAVENDPSDEDAEACSQLGADLVAAI